MSLTLPALPSANAAQGQTVPPVQAPPVAPVAPAPAGPTAPYEATWTIPLEPAEPLTLAVGSALFFTATPKGPIEARSPTDGRVVWSRPFGADTDLVMSEDLVFVRSSGTLHALEQASGRTRWTMAAAAGMPRPLSRAGWLIVAAGQSLRAFRAADGSAVWQRDLEAPVTRPLVVGGDRLFAVTGTNLLVAIDVKTGEVRGKAPLESQPESLLVLGDHVYFGSGTGHFVAFRQEPLRYTWSVHTFAATIGEPVGDDRYVYVALVDNTVRVLDRRQGTERNKIKLNDRPAPNIFLAGKYLIVPVRSGNLAVYDPALTRIVGVLTVAPAANQASSLIPTLEAVAGSEDGTELFRVVRVIDDTRSLTGFRRVK